MARSGIYKSEVVRARDKLLAIGQYPSIDAVRIELGNTGSKASIHKCLKEIEEEEGASTGSKVSTSEALHDLVSRLAERLQIESDEQINKLVASHTEQNNKQVELQKNLIKEVAELKIVIERNQIDLIEGQKKLHLTEDRLSEEILVRSKETQQLVDLQDRLLVEERHIQSLEDKYEQARQALEHFRSLAKEQREQEQRQHESQVQFLQGELKRLNQIVSEKQDESIQRNKENARILSELAKAESEPFNKKEELRAFKGVNEELASTQHQKNILGRRVVELEDDNKSIHQLNKSLEIQIGEHVKQIQELQINLATFNGMEESNKLLTDKFQHWMIEISEKEASKPKRIKKQVAHEKQITIDG